MKRHPDGPPEDSCLKRHGVSTCDSKPGPSLPLNSSQALICQLIARHSAIPEIWNRNCHSKSGDEKGAIREVHVSALSTVQGRRHLDCHGFIGGVIMNIDTASDDCRPRGDKPSPSPGRTGKAPEVGLGPGVPFAIEGVPIRIAGGP